MKDEKTRLEAMFPIGRPAPNKAYKTCCRCKGTGWWELGRQCFRCGGVGHAEKITVATRLRDARAHLAERLAMVAADRARLAEKIAAGRPRWTWMSIEERLPAELETIARIEDEIAALGAQP